MSLGSAVLGIYAARKGATNPLSAQVGIGCHFDKKFIDHITTYCFGLFDYVLGTCLIMSMRKTFEDFDSIISKTRPEIQIMPMVRKAKTLSKDVAEIATVTGGFKNIDHYLTES